MHAWPIGKSGRTREAGGSIKPGAQAPGKPKQRIFFEPAIAGVSALSYSVAHFVGSVAFFIFNTLGLRPQALCFHPLRGFGACYRAVQFNQRPTTSTGTSIVDWLCAASPAETVIV